MIGLRYAEGKRQDRYARGVPAYLTNDMVGELTVRQIEGSGPDELDETDDVAEMTDELAAKRTAPLVEEPEASADELEQFLAYVEGLEKRVAQLEPLEKRVAGLVTHSSQQERELEAKNVTIGQLEERIRVLERDAELSRRLRSVLSRSQA